VVLVLPGLETLLASVIKLGRLSDAWVPVSNAESGRGGELELSLVLACICGEKMTMSIPTEAPDVEEACLSGR